MPTATDTGFVFIAYLVVGFIWVCSCIADNYGDKGDK